MKHIYIDTEFDAVKRAGNNVQSIISIGAVACMGEGQTCERFYMLCCPQGFVKLTPVVRRMTSLQSETIRQALPFSAVIRKFIAWVHTQCEDEPYRLYGFGPDDRRTLLANCAAAGIDGQIFADMIDVQKCISAHIHANAEESAAAFSLDDLKFLYGIQGAVEHNALADACDLMLIEQAYAKGQPIMSEKLAALTAQKRKKQQERKRQRQQRCHKNVQEKLSVYIGRWYVCKPSSMTKNWQQLSRHLPFQIADGLLQTEAMIYPFAQYVLAMYIDISEAAPLLRLRLLQRATHTVYEQWQLPLQERSIAFLQELLYEATAC